MSTIHYIEFKTAEGVLLQRVDRIDSILETHGTGKNRGRGSFLLLLANGVRVEILGETRESLRTRMRDQGSPVVFVALPREPEPTLRVVPTAMGNAVLAAEVEEEEPLPGAEDDEDDGSL